MADRQPFPAAVQTVKTACLIPSQQWVEAAAGLILLGPQMGRTVVLVVAVHTLELAEQVFQVKAATVVMGLLAALLALVEAAALVQ
jgi:hypothetical protein